MPLISSLRSCIGLLALLAASLLLPASLPANEKDGRLEIYFIDVEGGAATLIVTPGGESVLIDSGYPDNGGRDRDRILKALKQAGRKQIDHAIVSHFHLDHYGNHASLASQIRIANFWDRGIPDQLEEDKLFSDRIESYRAASQNKSKKLSVGDKLPLKSGKVPLTATVVTASGDVLPNSGPANEFAAEHKPQAEDTSDNARSISLLIQFGDFKFLTCGDLTWNTEARLMTPNNPIGKVDLFMVTHHGLSISNNPVLVLAIDPVVTVMCNGPTKGGDPETQKTIRRIKSLEAAFQLHRNVALKPAEQTPAENIANDGKSEGCRGLPITARIAADGASYTVQIGDEGKLEKFMTRKN